MDPPCVGDAMRLSLAQWLGSASWGRESSEEERVTRREDVGVLNPFEASTMEGGMDRRPALKQSLATTTVCTSDPSGS